jgi:serine/threonine protein kinase/TPR repeat protein/chaperone required for assembly of F1-ATPase
MPTADRYHQYEVLRREDGSLWELGRGAMGITYKAYDTNLRFTVALKVINSAYLESDTARQRFLREARAAAALRHPNVASVFNLGTDQDKYFYVMEFIDGETLEAVVKRKGPLQPVEVLNIALQVSRALAVAAKQQLVHRDLKPSNLMLVDEEGESLVKVIDFGLAKVQKDAGEDSGALTMGGFVGTPHFASPEQVEEGDVDIRSDIYSLGATLYFVLTGQSPFSGSVGQIMSQHLYKPLPMAPLASLPRCVVSLLQQMMEKDRRNRPQTPQDLQKAILACLQEIRALSSGSGSKAALADGTLVQDSGSETLDLTAASTQPLSSGAVLAQNYKLVEEIAELAQGRMFLAVDLRRKRRVNLLVLSPEYLANASRLTDLEEALRPLGDAPHPTLREIYSLETVTECTFLVEEYVAGPSLLEVLRTRSVLTASEVVRLINLLAPLADHASSRRLRYVDFTLSGIHLMDPASTASGVQPDLLRRPLTTWESLQPKVDAIDFSFSPANTETWAGAATRLPGSVDKGGRDSYVRLLGLLAYELLGGHRARLETTGQYTPLALLTQEGNAVLRRGVIDEYRSAGELARQLAAAAGVTGPASTASQSKGRAIAEPPSRIPPPEIRPKLPSKPKFTPNARRLALALCVIAFLGIVFYLFYLFRQSQEIPALSVQSEPPGASILLDGSAPTVPPSTFTHVLFGTHQLTATLDNYEPIKQEIKVREGMTPEIRLRLKPSQEIAALSVHSDPAGAAILLDGKPPQAPSNTFTHVPFGTHQLTATLNDYEAIKQEIQVRKGMTPEIHLQLKPIQEIAALSVHSEPAGAELFLDGKPPQTPPNTFTHVPFGAHQLTATLNDYEPIKEEIQVHKGVAPEIHLQLKPIQEIAALSVHSEPAGAELLLDGKSPQAPPNTFTHVPFGAHQLTATLDDYEPIKEEIQVRKGMTPEIRLQLKPIQEIAALSVRSEPAGAELLLDGKPPQTPPNTFTHIPFGAHQLTATLSDYEPIKQEIQVRKGMSPEIRLQLKPIQEIAALSVRSEPDGAELFLDGKPPQTPPNTFTHVPFGAHQLTATLDDYEPIKEEIQVHKGMTAEIHLQLKPIQEMAALSVRSEPAGAELLLDGKPPQAPPNTFTHVPFGTHQLIATLDDYEPIKQEIQVRKGMAPEMHLQLRPIQEMAALSIRSEPAGAELLLDGKPPQAPPNTFTHVPFGAHHLSATLDDYEPIKQEIQVRRGMVPEMHLQLKPIQEMAALSIRSEPAGAELLLDGKPPQAPPNTFTHVPFGAHQLTATLEDYEPVKQEIQVRKGMTPEIHLQLKPIQEIAALSVRTEPAGAELLLDGKPPQVPPNTFTHVPFGTHELTATLDNYETIKQYVEVRPGMTTELPLQLKPIQDKGEGFASLRPRAELGDSHAMMKLGRLYLKKGTPTDDAEGFKWLTRAYEAPDRNLEAGAYIGDCYLSGRGTKQDVQKAEEIIMPLANQGIVPAMTLAGRILQYKADVARQEAAESTNPQVQKKLEAQANDLDRHARLWWERAEKDDWNASAHLGEWYEEGWGGLAKNENEAEKRYKAGTDHGNALSMFFYGLLIQKKPGRHSEAESLIARAAAMGLPSAIKWCKDNNVSFAEIKPDGERQ